MVCHSMLILHHFLDDIIRLLSMEAEWIDVTTTTVAEVTKNINSNSGSNGSSWSSSINDTGSISRSNSNDKEETVAATMEASAQQ